MPLLVPGLAKSQVNPQTGHGAPSGPCLGPYTDIDTGNFYVCKVGQYSLAGGSSVSPTQSSIPGIAGLNAVPNFGVLMAEHRMLPTETCGGLLDYSGNSANATGTVGTAPTIIAATGGCNFTGNGAVSYPASLNFALTYVAYITFQGNGTGTNGINAILQGNGAGANSGGNGFWLASCGVASACAQWTRATEVQHNDAWLGTYAGNGNAWKSQSWTTVNGSGCVAEVETPTADIVYLNGGVGPILGFAANPSSAGLQTTGNFQLGGAAANIGNFWGVATWYTGQIFYDAFYSTALTQPQIAEACSYMQAAMVKRGVVPQIPSNPTLPLLSASDTTNQLVANGTSITAGNAAIPYTTPIVNGLNGGPWNVFEAGQPANTCLLIMGQAPYLVDPALRPSANRNVTVLECGTNDGTSTAALAAVSVGYMREHCNARHAVGMKCLIISMLSRNTLDANKNLLNAEMRSRWNTFADGFVDEGATTLGADGASGNTALFSDGIHPTQYGFYNLYTWPVQRAVNALYGNQSFSEATTYVAASLAATATTAGTSGSNTITITFGATPANCQVGNRITLAGITPAGYNDTYLILTRSATQITAWASAALLGPITVQGTGVCPQQQDQDVYTILNFGAGNFTLQSCVGYTGQNLYIRNINAGATTLVPFASETITGIGAASATLAATSTAILQSQLVSSAAGGCNWVRLQ